MKKYFVKGIDEPLEYGDTIDFDLVKTGEDGKTVTKHVEVDFLPETKDMLLDSDAIEEKEVEDDKEPSVEDVVNGGSDYDLDDIDNDCPLEEDIDNVNESISVIADILKGHQSILKNLLHRVEVLEKKKEPIDVFNDSHYKSDLFEPVITALYASL